MGRHAACAAGCVQAGLGQAPECSALQAQRQDARGHADRVIVFPGHGVSGNPADKARKSGIPVMRLDRERGGA